MATLKTATLPLLIVATILSQSAAAAPADRNMAKRIHDRLTGVPPSNATLDAMETRLVSDPTGKTAATYAIDTSANPRAHNFYNVTLKNFATPWTNEEQTVFSALNDYSATVIGTIRDGVDFREILHGNLLYVGRAPGIPAYSNSNNSHYEQLEDLDPDPNAPNSGNLADITILEKTTQTAESGLQDAATAGIITTRAAAMAFFSDGTNRAMLRFTMMNHLCTDLEPLKDVSRNPNRIRQDVSRSPGGDSRIFLNGCVGCHAGLDGLAGAYAYYEWEYEDDKADGSLVYTENLVSEKHLINPTNFESGYITTDDSWINYWRNGPNSKLGNRPPDDSSGWAYPGEILDASNNAVGNGAKSLGIELANSKAFAQCQVDKVFKSICLRDPNVAADDRAKRDDIVDNFVTPGTNTATGGTDGAYDMREVFTDTAAYCRGG